MVLKRGVSFVFLLYLGVSGEFISSLNVFDLKTTI